MLDELVAAVRDGESRALVLHGEAGMGKSALLDYVANHAPGCRVARTAGVQSEIELPFAGLHQLCSPMLGRLDRLPPPQGDALRTAFGMSAGPAPDRFLIALATLSLLSEVAADEPLICLVDDQQWLDFASAQMLAFAARRLGAESVGLLFATRVPGGHLAGLPELAISGLKTADAGALLDSVVPGKLDPRVRDQIIAETGGNPLALLELPRGLSPAELAVGFEFPGAVPLEGTIEGSFQRRIAALPAATRQLLLIAASDPTGDPALLWRAAARLGIGPQAAEPASAEGLAEFATRVRFRHTLVRSAVYRSASAEDRQEAHRALAAVTAEDSDPERRAWHRAQAAAGPDEDVAGALEWAAGLAVTRGCLAAAGAYLARATTLTPDPPQRSRRAVLAAEGKIRAGAFDTAAELLAVAEAGALGGVERARVDLVRAQLAFVTNRGNDATPLLLQAAAQFEPVDADLSRDAYLEALAAAIFAGRLARPGADVPDVARLAAERAITRAVPDTLDRLLDGLVSSVTKGDAIGTPIVRAVLTDFGADMSTEDELRWLWLASTAALRAGDVDAWDALSARHLQLARDTGALSELPLALLSRTYVLLFEGDLTAALSLSDETRAVNEAIGSNLAPYGPLGLAAFRGEEAETLALVEATVDDVTRRGEGVGITFARWANAVLYNGLGHYDRALSAAEQATAYEDDAGATIWAAAELTEAASRTGASAAARRGYHRLSEIAGASGTNWAMGLEARARALIARPEEAEDHYRRAIAFLGQTRMRTDLARAHLVYGEWLRRQRRSTDSRDELRRAHRMFEETGMAGFAERARGELRAAGETVRKRSAATRQTELTAQEAQIARLARDGLSNPEIATRLFISAHTVQYHLRKVFAKLGISSRSQLDRVLPSR